jgi:peptide/nickel transport system substrate-binding protein
MSDDEAKTSFDLTKRRYTRRDVIKGAAVAGAAVSLGPLVAACGGGTSPASSPTAAASPRRGGVLRAGLTGGSSSDTLDALNGWTNVDEARAANIFEPLIGFGTDGSLQPVLAEEMVPNADATVWTIRLKSGVTWHDGKALTADDVMYTFRRIRDPKNPAEGANALALLDIGGMKKLDALTLRVPCTAPFSTFRQAVATIQYVYIVPEGYDPKKPVGTGPFEVVKFTPGEQSTFKRYPDYWQTGLPYLDQVIITNYPDETSQVNALLGGQVDVVNLLSSGVLSSVKSQGKEILVSPGGGWTPFTMRVDSSPFNDVRVRQAMRLIVDRKQMLDLLFAGYGTIGNDIFSPMDPAYDRQIPQRQQDIEQAKSLLKAAGREGLSVELVTADIAQGTVRAAQVFAQQAKAAGVKVKLRKTTVTDFYGPNYLKWVFAQDFWYFAYYLPQVANSTLADSPFNETHWNDPKYEKLYLEALRTVDDAKRYDICHEMQLTDYNEGGYIIPFFPPALDGYAPNVHGLVPSKVGVSLNNYAFKYVWLT